MYWYVIAALSSVAGGLVLLVTVGGSASAPQQAAGAAIAVSLAVIPYIFARCIDLTFARSREDKRHKDLLIALGAQR